jgi:cytochrome c-type biogenesis protein CcmH
MKQVLTGLFLALLLWPALVLSSAPLVFNDSDQEQRFQHLTEELRCLVCQNQNLADSDAPLAQDLRQEIHDMLMAGRSDDEIRSFLVDRYGDFVLYRPAVKGNTLMLWLAPVLLLLAGGVVVAFNVRRHRLTEDGTALDPEDTDQDATL